MNLFYLYLLSIVIVIVFIFIVWSLYKQCSNRKVFLNDAKQSFCTDYRLHQLPITHAKGTPSPNRSTSVKDHKADIDHRNLLRRPLRTEKDTKDTRNARKHGSLTCEHVKGPLSQKRVEKDTTKARRSGASCLVLTEQNEVSPRAPSNKVSIRDIYEGDSEWSDSMRDAFGFDDL